jgi:molybdate transport system regulatory protein
LNEIPLVWQKIRRRNACGPALSPLSTLIAMASTKARRSREPVAPRIKVWIEIDGSYVFGRGISDILKAVDEAGSIKQAAVSLGKSYRYVWKRIKDAESALGAPLVETQVGGKDAHRSDLTELARTLVEEFDRLRARMGELIVEEFPERLRRALDRGSSR